MTNGGDDRCNWIHHDAAYIFRDLIGCQTF
jgi:hypothetical protein